MSHKSSAVGTPRPALVAQGEAGRDITAAAAFSSQDPVSCSVRATRSRRQPPGAVTPTSHSASGQRQNKGTEALNKAGHL